jgi:N-hydroxyarylamine O-acetyltransferase
MTLVQAYLARIGYTGALLPARDTLTALHQAHVGAIPFENLDILLGRVISLEADLLQAKLVAGRRGGYCFEQNTLFQAALEALGFRTTALAARVRSGAPVVRPRTHMLLRVELAEGPFLADVGFGADGPVHPIPFQVDVENWVADSGHRLRREDESWVLEGNLTGEWTDLYAFTLEAQHPVDFEMASHFTSTHPSSSFRQTLTAQRSWPGRRAILRDRDLVLREGRDTRQETIRDPEHLLEVLEQRFDLAFPAGTRFSAPAFPSS